mmetsp:Transcript_43592/g.31818  ORF Transcript_43592/g.31818 Transcript_43592/m.31818 type:complete len:83 (+) Transcript_43592:827-1075(+)
MGGHLKLYGPNHIATVPARNGQVGFFRSDFTYHSALTATFEKRLITFFVSIRKKGDTDEWLKLHPKVTEQVIQRARKILNVT